MVGWGGRVGGWVYVVAALVTVPSLHHVCDANHVDGEDGMPKEGLVVLIERDFADQPQTAEVADVVLAAECHLVLKAHRSESRADVGRQTAEAGEPSDGERGRGRCAGHVLLLKEHVELGHQLLLIMKHRNEDLVQVSP